MLLGIEAIPEAKCAHDTHVLGEAPPRVIKLSMKPAVMIVTRAHQIVGLVVFTLLEVPVGNQVVTLTSSGDGVISKEAPAAVKLLAITTVTNDDGAFCLQFMVATSPFTWTPRLHNAQPSLVQ